MIIVSFALNSRECLFRYFPVHFGFKANLPHEQNVSNSTHVTVELVGNFIVNRLSSCSVHVSAIHKFDDIVTVFGVVCVCHVNTQLQHQAAAKNVASHTKHALSSTVAKFFQPAGRAHNNALHSTYGSVPCLMRSTAHA